MEKSTEPLGFKRRKLMSQTGNGTGSVGGSETAFPSDVLSGGVKVEGFKAGSAKAEAGSREQGASWPDVLSEAHLNLLVSIKQLAMERVTSMDETRLEEVLPASVLRTIGILMEELVKDRVRNLASAHENGKVHTHPDITGKYEDSIQR